MDKNNELIISESVISGLMPSHSLGKEAVKKICDRLPDLYKGTLAVGRQNKSDNIYITNNDHVVGQSIQTA